MTQDLLINDIIPLTIATIFIVMLIVVVIKAVF